MQIEECFLEMICHSRWVFNYCLTRLDARVAEEYSEDLLEFRAALEAISLPHSNVNEIVDVPSVAVEALCKGVCYLLLGEEVLGGNAPTTMHQFLRQTKGRRLESAKQAHIITIRWFVNAGLLQIEDLLQVIYGDTVQLSDYASDYEAQTAVAEALSTPEPFYLGAHVSILRALLLQYCSTIITADDIVSHVLKVDPSATAELYTLEDTLLFWLKSILQLSPSEVCNALTTDLSDVYLHTNDGRILSLVVHYYQPQALTLDGLHLDGDSPTISERQANWSKIISAAESLGLWVGIFASEVVTHGFATLQLHVLRIVEELFAILAVGVENSYKDILNNLGVSRPSSNSASAQHYGGGSGQVSIRGSSILRNSVRQSLVATGASAMNHNNSSVGKRSVASSISEGGGGVMSANHHDESDYPQADTTIINNTIMTSVCSPEMDHSTAMIGYDPNRSAFTTSSVGDRMVVNHADGEDNDEDCSSHISAMLTGNYSPVPSHRGGGGGDTSVASSIKDGLDTLGPNRGESSSIRREIIARTASLNNEEGPSTVQSLDRGTDAHRTNVTESVGSSTSGGANSGGGDYNIILTNMFLQGVAVPVHRTAATDSKSPPQPEYRSTTNSPPPPASAQLGSLGSVNSYNNNSHDDDEGGSPRMDHQRTAKSAPRFDDTQELSAYVRASGTSSCGSWKADNNNNHQPTTPRNQSGSALDAPEFADSPAPITQSQDGPVRRSRNGAGSRLDNPPTSTESPTRVSTSTNRRSLIAGGGDNMDGVNASPGASLLTASLAKLHKDRVSRSSMNILSHSLQRPRVQGSIDEDGIGDLIAELKALSRQAPPEPPLVANMSPPPADELEHQNRNLRAALSHQQKIVAAFIDQFQRGLQNQKQFDVIANHLASSIALPKSGGGGDKPKLVSTAVGQSFAGDSIHQIKKRAPLSITQQLNSPTPTSLLSLPTPSVEMLDESTYGRSTATTGADYDNDEDNKPLTHGGGKRRHLPGTLIKQSYNKLPVGLSVNLLESQQRREVGPTSVVMESIDNPTPLPALKKVPISMKGGGTTTNTTTATRLAPPAPSAFDVSIDNLRANKGAGKPPPHLLERLEAGAPTNNTKQQHGIIQQRQMVRGRGGGGNNRTGAVIKIDQNTSGGDDSALLPPLQQQHNNHHAAAEVPAGVRIWNNKSSITLALRHALLPGSVNKSSLDSVLGTIEDCIANNDGTGMQQQFVVLLKDEFAHIFRGLYVLKPTGQLTRVFGSGPLEAYVGPDLTAGNKNQPKSPWSPHLQKLASHTAAMHPRFFKFDTSNKKFLLMPHSEANNTTDAITFSKVSKVARERW